MNKSNVTNNQVGWLIFRPDTEEFVYAQRSQGSAFVTGYVKEPSLAFTYSSEQSAFRASTFIDKPTQVVPLFDCGDRLAVGFPED